MSRTVRQETSTSKGEACKSCGCRSLLAEMAAKLDAMREVNAEILRHLQKDDVSRIAARRRQAA